MFRDLCWRYMAMKDVPTFKHMQAILAMSASPNPRGASELICSSVRLGVADPGAMLGACLLERYLRFHLGFRAYRLACFRHNLIPASGIINKRTVHSTQYGPPERQARYLSLKPRKLPVCPFQLCAHTQYLVAPFPLVLFAETSPFFCFCRLSPALLLPLRASSSKTINRPNPNSPTLWQLTLLRSRDLGYASTVSLEPIFETQCHWRDL